MSLDPSVARESTCFPAEFCTRTSAFLGVFRLSSAGADGALEGSMRFFLVLGVVAGLTTVACGGDDSKPAGDSTAADTAIAPAPAPAATDAPKETTPKSDAVATSTSPTEPAAKTDAPPAKGDGGAADPPAAEPPKGDDDDDGADANPLTCFTTCAQAACQDPNACAGAIKTCNDKCFGGDK